MKNKNPKTTSKAVLKKNNHSKEKLKKTLRTVWERANNSKNFLIMFAITSFLVPFLIGNYSIHSKNQLRFMDGLAEEYVALGTNLYYNGRYELEENKNFYFRPPGYPYFISCALKLWNEMPSKNYRFSNLQEMFDTQDRIENHLYFMQNILLGLTVLLIFGIAAHFLKPVFALFISLLFGCNPYFLMLIGLLHYEILHMFLLSLGTFLLIHGFDYRPRGYLCLFFSGLIFGMATLVRPITLILPVFVFLGLFVSEKKRIVPAAIKALAFTFCMMVVIAPYSWRNYQLSNTFIPVNAQSGVAFWSGTVKVLPIEPNHYRWWDLWYTEGNSIFHKVAGPDEGNTYSWPRYNLELEKEFKKEAYSNLRKQPFTYILNVMMNFISINFCVNSVYLKIFDYIQFPDNIFQKTFLSSSNDQKFHDDWQANLFTFLFIVLMVCAGAGFYLGIKNKDFCIIPVMAIYLCVTIAHSITYMDIMYYYVKMPFLFIFLAYFLKQLLTLKNCRLNYLIIMSMALPGLLTLVLLFDLILI